MDLADIDWPTAHMSDAFAAARKSKDRRTQVGAVIVGRDQIMRSKGYNGPCRGMDDADPEIHDRANKHLFAEHGERNAVYNAAWVGVSTRGCDMYVTLHPCVPCARAIVQAGIRNLFLHRDAPGHDNLNVEQQKAAGLLSRCGVEVHYIEVPLTVDTLRYDGEVRRVGDRVGPKPTKSKFRIIDRVLHWFSSIKLHM